MAEIRDVDPSPPEQGSSETLVAIQSWEGPLPAPETLERFEAVVPGSAKTIIEEWQAETRHRRKFGELYSSLPMPAGRHERSLGTEGLRLKGDRLQIWWRSSFCPSNAGKG